MKQTLRIIILCYSFILFEGLLFSMLADTGKAEKEVLVLNSINFNLPWSKHFYWCVHDELSRGVFLLRRNHCLFPLCWIQWK